MYNNRNKFVLKSLMGKLELEIDPMGWDDTETEIGRSNKTYGIFLTISNNLNFHGYAFNYLETLYQIYGVQAEVELTKYVKHPQTDEWQLAFTGYLDFSTRKVEDGNFKVDFIEGGLREILTSNMREKFEINRAESIKGVPITPFVPDSLSNGGREILLVSKLSSEENKDFYVRSGRWSSGNDYREVFQAFPMQIIANSDPENISAPQESGRTDGTDPINANSMFFTIADRKRGNCVLDFWFSFKFSAEGVRSSNNTLDVVIRRYTGNGTTGFVLEQEYQVATIPFTPGNQVTTGQRWNFSPEEGESYAIGLKLRGQYGSLFNDGWIDLYINNYTGTLTWTEDSYFDPTVNPMVTAFDLGNRLTEIFTGIPKFKSKLLSEGTWEDLGFTCGGWIRNLKKKTEEGVTVDWPLTISFEDYYKSLNAILPVGYGIAKKGAKQFICLESIRYFFQPLVMIRLGQVSKVKRSIEPDFVYSSLTLGYQDGGEYEQPLGLDEYNINTTYITPITVTDNNYNVAGPSRADVYAIEQARRKPYEKYPDEDTPFDKDNFLIDTKLLQQSNIRNYYEFRLWQDDFEEAPTGIYSPQTAANLRLSPANCRTRHSIWFNTATVKYPTDKLRYSSSEGNNQLKTKFIGKDAIKENDDVVIGDLSNPIFEPEYIEFEIPFSQDIFNQLQGTTVINGEEINNYYGLVEFTNENNQQERGYLFSAKIKETMKFKLIKSYGF